LLKQGLAFSADNELLNIALGYAYFNYGSAVLGAGAHDEYLDKAMECAERVLAVKPNSPDGNGLLGLILYDRFETAKGLQLLRKGVDAPDRNLDTLTYAAMIHSMCGQTKIAKAWVDELGRVDPLHGYSQFIIAWQRLMEGDFEGAESFVRRANELEPDAPMFRTALGLVLIFLGRKSDARGVLEAGHTERPRREVWHIVGRILHHILCQEPEAASQLLDDDLKQDAKTDMLYSWLLADCYAMLGDLEASLDWLGNAVDGGFLNYQFFRHMDPLLSSLRGREDFDLLMTRLRDRWRSVELGSQ
jgi:tetratricopeptide (TPR) repeat protein